MNDSRSQNFLNTKFIVFFFQIRYEYKNLLNRIECLKRLTVSRETSANVTRDRDQVTSREARSTTQTPGSNGNSSIVNSQSTQDNSPHHVNQEPSYTPRVSYHSS